MRSGGEGCLCGFYLCMVFVIGLPCLSSLCFNDDFFFSFLSFPFSETSRTTLSRDLGICTQNLAFALLVSSSGSITPDWARVTRSLGDGGGMKMRRIRGDGCVGVVDGVADRMIDSRDDCFIHRRDEPIHPIPAKPPGLKQRQFKKDITSRNEHINHQTSQRETARLRAVFFPHPDGTDLHRCADGVHFADEEEGCEAVDLEA